jgi:5'-3' exonuclease
MVRKKYIEPNETIVLEKAIVGDASDGIPGIPGIGIKTFEKIIKDRNEWNKKIKNGKMEMLKKFINIIDLRKFPNEYKQNILLEDENNDLNTFDADGVEMFLFENNLNQLLNNWNITKNEFMEK